MLAPFRRALLREYVSMILTRLFRKNRPFRTVGAPLGSEAPAQHALATVRCSDFEAFQAYLSSTEADRAARAACEAALVPREPEFLVSGFCVVCQQPARFRVGYAHGVDLGAGRRVPNWREQLTCTGCGLNNRMRAAVAFMLAQVESGASIYLTEQVTPLFRVLSGRRPRVIGSEFLRDGTARGRCNAEGIRHEDLTRLSLPDRSVDCIGTFDVLEHVPDYKAALSEMRRCLRPNGTVVMTVPFDLGAMRHAVRARVEADGSITHLMEPEYHGDPLDESGVLCFYHFGWDLLDDFRACGFRDAALHFYWSRPFGFLGGTQFLIGATG